MKNKFKTLIIGYGSIGQRHARLLVDLGCKVAIVSHRPIDFSSHFSNIKQALSNWNPDYVVIANQTSEHRQSLLHLVENNFKGKVLIEKPLMSKLSPLPNHNFKLVRVAYNLRCHPIMLKLKSLLNNGRESISSTIYVGSYLPNWRPTRDYRNSYSAKKHKGGGVLRDLSHELDYVLWLFGAWKRLTASGGKLSQLKIESEDAFSVLMETKRCPLVSIHMNYLDRTPRRKFLINTQQDSIHIDLIKNTITVNGIKEFISVERDDTYRSEHLAMLSGKKNDLCTLEEANETLYTIESVEHAAKTHTWIKR